MAPRLIGGPFEPRGVVEQAQMPDQLSSDLASLRIERDAPPGGPGGKTVFYAVFGVALIALLVGVYIVGAHYVEAKIFKPEVTVTEILVVSPAQSSVQLTSSGYVVAEVTSKVGAKVEGRISKIHVKEGSTVK